MTVPENTKPTLLAAAVCLILFAFPLQGMAQQSVAADVLCAVKFDKPATTESIRYLGLGKSDQFSLRQVKADVVVVEIFDMYCPHCQAEAPNVNRLHQLVESSPAHKDRVKLIGVGLRNTPYEVELFRGKFDVPFPLVADPDAQVQTSSEQLFRTPTFIILKKNGKSTFRVTQVHLGRITDVEEFLRSITGR